MSETNVNSRLEAFCDGVFAIALTLLIIDIKIPASESIGNSSDLWLALRNLAPTLFAFVLSFIVILITWVNHHNAFKLIERSSGYFIYANGLLLLTVVVVPFPTSLLGDYLFTDHAAPAVILYEAVMASQAVAWVLIAQAALKGNLIRDEHSAHRMRMNQRKGWYAIWVYLLLLVLAIWFPLAAGLVTAMLWIFWLIVGIKLWQA